MNDTVVTGPPIAETTSLTERCDRCGAAGKLRVFLAGGGDLTFCGHHANRFNETIRTSAERLVVESGFGWRLPAA